MDQLLWQAKPNHVVTATSQLATRQSCTRLVSLLISMISVYYTASHGAIVSAMSTKPSSKLQSMRDRWPNLFQRRASSQLTSSPTPPPGPSTATPTSSSEPPDSQESSNAFVHFIDGVDEPQTMAKTVYNGFKTLLDVIDKVGYAIPPLKAAAAGIGRIMTVVDVCTSRRLATNMLELSTPP